MFLAPPGDSGLCGGLAVRRARHLAFPARAPAGPDPVARRYLADMLAANGLPSYGAPSGVSYADMVGPILLALEPEPLDVVAVAHAGPDCQIHRSVGGILASYHPQALCFAVSDQGCLAPFTAVRVILGYARAGLCRRAALLVLNRAPDLAVGILLDGVDGPGRVEVSWPGPAQLGELVGRGPARVVNRAGPGGWVALAEALSAVPRDGVVLADYDPASGRAAALSIH